MAEAFWRKAGSLLSPGDLFLNLPYVRTPHPLLVARKWSKSLPSKYRVQRELREVFEFPNDHPTPAFRLSPPGEDVLSNAKFSMAIFLTWGSEVEDDERGRNPHRKDWLIAPVFPIEDFEGRSIVDSKTAESVNLARAIREGKSPKYFPLQPIPSSETPGGYYADFRRIWPLATKFFSTAKRDWTLGRAALNDFYSHLIWFFTRKKIFFEPLQCPDCGAGVDLNVVFEGQNLDPEPEQ